MCVRVLLGGEDSHSPPTTPLPSSLSGYSSPPGSGDRDTEQSTHFTVEPLIIIIIIIILPYSLITYLCECLCYDGWSSGSQQSPLEREQNGHCQEHEDSHTATDQPVPHTAHRHMENREGRRRRGREGRVWKNDCCIVYRYTLNIPSILGD